MNNDTRQSAYLRDRGEPTPAQRRRLVKHEHAADAQFSRAPRRRARRQVLRAERGQRLAIRAYFAARRRRA